jgi:endogenous inhibitor of DNA gyrase (YacG/DUF329 family)
MKCPFCGAVMTRSLQHEIPEIQSRWDECPQCRYAFGPKSILGSGGDRTVAELEVGPHSVSCPTCGVKMTEYWDPRHQSYYCCYRCSSIFLPVDQIRMSQRSDQVPKAHLRP